ncbi:MAG: tetratricopeptide repeat protein, partial [Armatimonadota bacterium]
MTPILDANALYKRGFELRCEGRYIESKAELQKVLQLDPNHFEAKWQLGLIQGFEGDFEGSLATLQKLADENPSHTNIRYDL